MSVLDDLRNAIRYASSNAPRSLQTSLGPSEVGHPCPRRLALGLMREPRTDQGDPLPSVVGTAAHTWMEACLRTDNQRLGRTRWIPEQRVEIRPGLGGTCDCYDVDTATVIDFKFPGPARLRKYKQRPSLTYRNQVHLYGRGYQRLGLPVKTVAVAFFPRGGVLVDAYVHAEPYDDDRVDSVLARIDAVTMLCVDLDVEHDPAAYRTFPIVPDEDCCYCPFFSPHPKDDRRCDAGGNAAMPVRRGLPEVVTLD